MTTDSSYNAPIIYDSNYPYDAYAPVPLPRPSSPPATHLAVPMIVLSDGTFATNQQDSIQEVTQSVEVIVGSVQGQRTVVPSFGLPVMDFQTPSKGEYVRAIGLWDKRAAVEVTVAPSDRGAANVRVDVSLVKGTTT